MTTPTPILFAHRGGRAHAPENTMAAFENAIARGADGIETDAWVTRDGQVALHHGGVVGKRRNARRIATLNQSELPASVPTLDALLQKLSPDHHVFIDIKGGSIDAVVQTLQRHRPDSNNVWLAHSGYNDSDWNLTASWRAITPTAILVSSTSVDRMQSNQPKYLDDIAAAGIQCLNLPIKEWNASLVNECRARGLKTMAFKVHTSRRAAKAVRLQLDAVHGDNIDTLLRTSGR